jgi:hypothetical protein
VHSLAIQWMTTTREGKTKKNIPPSSDEEIEFPSDLTGQR